MRMHGVEDVLPLDADGQPLLLARPAPAWSDQLADGGRWQAEVSTSMTMVKYSWSMVWLMSRMLTLCSGQQGADGGDDAHLVLADDSDDGLHRRLPFHSKF